MTPQGLAPRSRREVSLTRDRSIRHFLALDVTDVTPKGYYLDIFASSPDAQPVTSGEQGSAGRSPTLEDVAAAAGVSRSTASRAINGGMRVSADAQAAVDAAVLSLRFTPNRAARALVTQRTNAVALVIAEPDDRVTGDPFFAQVIQGMGQALGDSDFQMVLLIAKRDGSAERTIRYLRHGHVDGAVVVSHHESDHIERALLSASLPSVFVGRPWYLPDQLGYVDTDNRLGAELATRHLLERGCPRTPWNTATSPPPVAPARPVDCSTGTPNSTPSSWRTT